MNAPFKPATQSDANAFDALAEADRPDRSFLRARWFLSGPKPASRLAVARDSFGSPLAGFAMRRKTLGPAWLGLSVNEVAGPYWPMRGVPVDLSVSAQTLGNALRESSLTSALGPAFRLGPVVRDHVSLQLLRDAAILAGWTVLSKPVGQHFIVDLAALTASGKWPSTSGQKKRRWHVRNLEKIGAVRIEYFTGADWTCAIRDAIAAIEGNSWLGQLENGGDTKFRDPALRSTWEDAGQDPALAAMIRGSLMWVGETPAAFTFGLDCGATRLLIANNFDQRFAKESPGKILIYEDFIASAARGIATMDLGLGDAGYKSDMGAHVCGAFVDLLFVRRPLLARALRPLWER